MAQRIVRTVWDENAQTIAFHWWNEKGADDPMFDAGGRPLVFRVADVPPETYRDLALHGAQQKACDGFSDAQKVSGGDPAKKREYIQTTIRDAVTDLYAGKWSDRGEGTERVTDTLEALVRVTGKPIEAVRAWYESQSPDAKTNIRKDARVVAARDAIKAERSAARLPSATPTINLDAI